MDQPFIQIWNRHSENCGKPPAITNASGKKYHGYFENRYGEQWVFVYDRDTRTGELRGGDIGWDTVVLVKDGHVNVTLGKAEAAWLQACWSAATFAA